MWPCTVLALGEYSWNLQELHFCEGTLAQLCILHVFGNGAAVNISIHGRRKLYKRNVVLCIAVREQEMPAELSDSDDRRIKSARASYGLEVSSLYLWE